MQATMRMLTATLLCAGFAAVSLPALAQSVDSNSIVESLKPKAKTRSLTRSLTGGSNGASAEDDAFLKNLPTRGIKINERKKLDEIVAKQDLPRIDIEINFDFNSAEIRADAKADVDELGKALTSDALSKYRIVLNGHTDSVGNNSDNQDLSERRAAAVRQYLIENYGIDENRLISIGYGEERLKNTADPEAAENRRVEVINLTQG
jgi:outer membrane protein OmpA-like peptidoglycan-associated protein